VGGAGRNSGVNANGRGRGRANVALVNAVLNVPNVVQDMEQNVVQNAVNGVNNVVQNAVENAGAVVNEIVNANVDAVVHQIGVNNANNVDILQNMAPPQPDSLHLPASGPLNSHLPLHDAITLDQLLWINNAAKTVKPARPTAKFSGDVQMAKAKGMTVKEEWMQLKTLLVSWLKAMGIVNDNLYLSYFFSHLEGAALREYNAIYERNLFNHVSWAEFCLCMELLIKGTEETSSSVMNRLATFDILSRAAKDDTPMLYTYLIEFRKDCSLLPEGLVSPVLLCQWLVRSLPAPFKYQFALDGSKEWDNLSRLISHLLMHSHSFSDVFAAHKRSLSQLSINSAGMPVPFSFVAGAPGAPIFQSAAVGQSGSQSDIAAPFVASSGSGTATATANGTISPPLPPHYINIYTQPNSSVNALAPSPPIVSAPPSAPPSPNPSLGKRSYYNQPERTYVRPRLGDYQSTPVNRFRNPAASCASSSFFPPVVVPQSEQTVDAPRNCEYKFYIKGITNNPSRMFERFAKRQCFLCQSTAHGISTCPIRQEAFDAKRFFFYPAKYFPKSSQ